MTVVRVKVYGVKNVIKNITSIRRNFKGVPFEKSMDQAARIVQRAAAKNAPVDTGMLKKSIKDEVYRAGGGKVVGAIGSNLKYSPFLEYPCRPHWPPRGALAGWAQRHNWNEYAIRYIISLVGTSSTAQPITGSMGFYYLHRAIEQNEGKIVSLIGNFVAKTVHRYS